MIDGVDVLPPDDGVEVVRPGDGEDVLAPSVLQQELMETMVIDVDAEIPDICEFSSDGENVSDSTFTIDGTDLSFDDEHAHKPLSSHEELYLIYKKHNLTRDAMIDLLKFMTDRDVDVPRSFYKFNRLTTPTDVNELSGGVYSYFGLKNAIETICQHRSGVLAHEFLPLEVKINIDGLPLWKSSVVSAWPILAVFDIHEEPLPIAVFCGANKPNLDEFLADLLKELHELKIHGIYFKGKHLKIVKVVFVCDAVARSYLQAIKSHTAKKGCGYCRCSGEIHEHRVSFPTCVSELRRDISYSRGEEDNQHFISPLSGVVPLMTGFPVDYQHCVCLGIVRRLFSYYFTSVKSFRLRCKLSQEQLKSLSDDCIRMAQYIPREFQRRPRRLDTELAHFKATEFRLFLLYIGPYLFKKYFIDDYFNHFLLLHFSMYVFSSSRTLSIHSHAKACLERFVAQMPQLFGQHSMSYNFHVVLHIPYFVEMYGPLDKFSTFPFENWLHLLKRRVKKTRFYAQNLINECRNLKNVDLANRDLYINCDPPNNCAFVNGHFILVTAVGFSASFVRGRRLQFVRDLYISPYCSQVLNIGFYSLSRDVICGPVTGKAIMIPHENEYLVIPFCNF